MALMMALCGACSDGELRRCRFGDEQTEGTTSGRHFHQARHLGSAVVWSATEGLFVRRAGRDAERLGVACSAGFDASKDGHGVVILCARRARTAADQAGALVAYRPRVVGAGGHRAGGHRAGGHRAGGHRANTMASERAGGGKEARASASPETAPMGGGWRGMTEPPARPECGASRWTHDSILRASLLAWGRRSSG